MTEKLKSYALNQLRLPIVRYFIMASFVVCVELATFVLINNGFKISYLVATPTSNVVAIILNWYLSIKLVFSGRRHKIHLEAVLIIFASLIGIGIQLVVAVLCVQSLGLKPLIGKIAAIIVAFFWSYWVRKRYIFLTDV